MYSLAPFHLTQIINSGTHVHHSGNISLIDLVFVSETPLLRSWCLVPPLGNSDHSGIQVELYANQLPASKVNRKKKVLWCLDRGDYAKMKRIIDSSNWNLYLSEDISSSVLMWQKHFLSIMEQCIPRKTLSSTHRLPWLY
jgi:hypothetical protein